MQLRLGLALTLSVLAFTGCSTLSNKLSVNNGSLDYKKASNLAPLQYPEGTTVRPVTPLYPAPVVDPMALERAPDFENQKGNRFAMPRPNEEVANRSAQKQVEQRYKIPVVVADSSMNPLLKVTGKSKKIWQTTLDTLEKLHYNVVDENKTRYEATIQVNQNTYLLKLSADGKNNTLVVFTSDNTFADSAQAKALLDQIAQNWSA